MSSAGVQDLLLAVVQDHFTSKCNHAQMGSALHELLEGASLRESPMPKAGLKGARSTPEEALEMPPEAGSGPLQPSFSHRAFS